MRRDETESVRPRTERVFYGWQILASGEVGGLLAGASMALPDPPIGGALPTAGFVLGLPLYILGGPIVHWTHDGFSKGLVSFGANIAVPFVAGLATMGAYPDRHTVGFAKGAAVGMLVVPIVDALVLGWEDVPVDVVTGRAVRSTRVSLLPAIEIRPGGAVALGIHGLF